MTNILMILLMTAFMGCHKEDPVMTVDPPDPEEEVEVFELEWATRMNVNKEIVGADAQFTYKDQFLCFGDLQDPANILAYSTSDGAEDWNFIQPAYRNIDFVYQINELLVCVSGDVIFGFNIEQREELWSINIAERSFFREGGVIYDDKLYMTVSERLHSPDGIKRLLEIDIYDGSWRTVLALPTDAEGSKHVSPPVLQETSAGTIMYYNEYPNHDSSPPDGIQSIVAYNLDTEEEVWRNEAFITEWATNGLHPPVIYEDRVITGGDYSMYGFDIHTGEQVWKTSIPGKDKFASFISTNHLVVDGKVYANPTDQNLMCLDAKTGELIWNFVGASNCTDNMTYYQDMLVFTSWGKGSVIVIDAITGDLIHRQGAYDNSIFNNDVVYDEETDMFFTSTYKHAMGFRINKPD